MSQKKSQKSGHTLCMFTRHSKTWKTDAFVDALVTKGDKEAVKTLTSKGDKAVPLLNPKDDVYAKALAVRIADNLNRYVITNSTKDVKLTPGHLEFHVICSEYLRTQQTADILLHNLKSFKGFENMQVARRVWPSLNEFQKEDDEKVVADRLNDFETTFRSVCANNVTQVMIFVGHASSLNAIMGTLRNERKVNIENAWVTTSASSFGMPLCGLQNYSVKVDHEKKIYRTMQHCAATHPNQRWFKVEDRHTKI